MNYFFALELAFTDRKASTAKKGKARALRPAPPAATALAVPPPGAPRCVSFSVLLLVYSILPLCVAVYLLDVFQFKGHLRATLPLSPESYFVLSLLFGTPHILASNIIFFTNKEYLRTYWAGAAWATLGIIAFFAVGSAVLTYNVMFAVVATATIIHVVKQQIGIGNMVARLSGWIYRLWIWTMIGSSVAMYNGIFLRKALSAQWLGWIDQGLAASSIVLVVSALWCHRHTRSRMGRSFLWANTVMILTSFYFYAQQYYFFAVLGPRIVHDGTAFIFYVVHDHNRHHPIPRNRLYRFMGRLGLKAIVIVPLMAIGGTLFLQEYADTYFGQVTHALAGRTFPHAIAFGFVGYLGLLHYYMEAFTWKGASPYRKYISFAP